MGRLFGYFTCFATGLVVLVLEMLAFRLLAPYFGTSTYVVGAIINTILLALAVGYLIGGYAVDRVKSYQMPYWVVLACALYMTAIYLWYPQLLQLFASYPVIAGSFAAVLCLFFVPMVLLAFVPPYLIKLILVESKVGAASGAIFSISTVGSIIGGLLTTFYLIPALGSRASLALSVIILYAVAILGLVRVRKTYALLAPLALVPLLATPGVVGSNIAYQTESEYNLITVVKAYGRHLLLLNDNLGIQSVSLDPETRLAEHFYTDYFIFPHLLREVDNTLILGNAAGTTMMSLAHYFDGKVDGVEIDPKITRVGQNYFGLELGSAKLRVLHQDGRLFLNANRGRYDVIAIDMYGGGPYIPFHVATLEFFRHAHAALRDNGVMVLNLPFFARTSRLEHYYLNTIGRSFKTAFRYRQVLYAFKTEVSLEQIEAAVASRSHPEPLARLAAKIVAELEPVALGSNGPVFTDDLAPVEALTFEALTDEWLDNERRLRKDRLGY